MENELTTRENFKEILDNTFIRNYDNPEVNKAKIKKFCQQVQQLKPQKLFRYRKFDDKTFDALQKNLITTSNPKDFNDPFDSLIYVDTREILDDIKNPRNRWKFKKWLDYNPILVEHLTKRQKTVIKGLLNESDRKYSLNIRPVLPKIERELSQLIADSINYTKKFSNIACFSETPLSPTMWGHYAKKHQGFVLEYDFTNYNSPCTNCQPDCRYKHYDLLFPVIYSNERFNAKDYMASYLAQSMFLKAPFKIFIPKDDELSIYKVLLHKSKDWEYEQEWRLISHCNTKPNIIQKPKGIYLGINMPVTNRRKLIDFAQNNGIPCYEMYIEYGLQEYKINYKPL